LNGRHGQVALFGVAEDKIRHSVRRILGCLSRGGAAMFEHSTAQKPGVALFGLKHQQQKMRYVNGTF
jgi:hypothetical protein